MESVECQNKLRNVAPDEVDGEGEICGRPDSSARGLEVVHRGLASPRCSPSVPRARFVKRKKKVGNVAPGEVDGEGEVYGRPDSWTRGLQVVHGGMRHHEPTLMGQVKPKACDSTCEYARWTGEPTESCGQAHVVAIPYGISRRYVQGRWISNICRVKDSDSAGK